MKKESVLDEVFRIVNWKAKHRLPPPDMTRKSDIIKRESWGLRDYTQAIKKLANLVEERKSIYRELYLYGEGKDQVLTLVERARKKPSQHGT